MTIPPRTAAAATPIPTFFHVFIVLIPRTFHDAWRLPDATPHETRHLCIRRRGAKSFPVTPRGLSGALRVRREENWPFAGGQSSCRALPGALTSVPVEPLKSVSHKKESVGQGKSP